MKTTPDRLFYQPYPPFVIPVDKEADATVTTDYTANCPFCNRVLPTTQHNNQLAETETVACTCGKRVQAIWSN